MKYLAIGTTIGVLVGIALSYALLAKADTIEYVATEEPKKEVQIEKTIEEKIRETFPEDPERAVAIAKCESNLIPSAVSPTHDYGIFQINHIHDARLKQLGLDKFRVDDNIAFARILYNERGFKPWVCDRLVSHSNNQPTP
jgi:hypothetical protein